MGPRAERIPSDHEDWTLKRFARSDHGTDEGQAGAGCSVGDGEGFGLGYARHRAIGGLIRAPNLRRNLGTIRDDQVLTSPVKPLTQSVVRTHPAMMWNHR